MSARSIVLTLSAAFLLLSACGEPPRPTVSIQQAAKTGNVEQLESHIYWGSDVNSVTEDDVSPITLVLAGESIEISQGLAALHYAVVNDRADVVDLLLSNGADPNLVSFFGYSPLHLAAIRGDLNIATSLINAGADVDIEKHSKLVTSDHPDEPLDAEDGYRPIHYAVSQQSMPVVRLLLDKGADVNAVASKYSTPLFIAIGNGNKEIASALLGSGANADAPTENSGSLIHAAAVNGDRDIFEILVNAGIDLNARDDDGWAPIHYASEAGSEEIVELLLKAGVDPNDSVQTEDGLEVSPLFLAVRGGNVRLVNLLQKAGSTLEANSDVIRRAFIDSCGNGDMEMIKFLVDAGVDVGSRFQMLNLQKSSARTSFERGAIGFANAQSVTTALHKAIENGQLEVVRYLLDNGAFIESIDGKGFAPLHVAVVGGYVEIAEYLIDKGAPIDKLSEENFKESTALLLAAKNNQLEVLTLLLERGADVSVRERGEARQAIHFATELGNLEMVQSLLDAGAKVNSFEGFSAITKDPSGLTPVAIATKKENYELVKLLMERGADPNLASSSYLRDEYAALGIAKKMGNTRLVELLSAN